MGGNRTYRVPKRVQREVLEGLSAYRTRGVRLEDRDALHVAEVLTAGHPVDASVAERITGFFSHDWRFHPQKVRVASLYGGEQGAAWAGKVVAAKDAPLTAAAAALSGDELVELATFTDDDFRMLLEYGRGSAMVAGVTAGKVGDVVVLVVDNSDDGDGDGADGGGDVGAGGGDAVVPVDAVAAADEESGLVSLAVGDAAAFAADTAGTADAVDSVDGVDSTDGGGGGDGADGGHHSEQQVRDSAGKFASVGSRVRNHDGALGWVTGHRDGAAVVETDDGREVVVPSDQFEVASVDGRGRLAEPPTLIEDADRRLREYLVWAKERMGVTAAGGGPAAGDGKQGAPSPLFMAEVDPVDTTAVLAVLAVIPTDEGTGLRVFERRDAGWTEVPEYVRAIKSVDPPSLVELDREMLLTVVEQLDQSDLSGEEEEGEPEAEAGPAAEGEAAEAVAPPEAVTEQGPAPEGGPEQQQGGSEQ